MHFREAMEMGYTAWAERAFNRHPTMRAAACSQPLGQETLEKGHYHHFLVAQSIPWSHCVLP
jgi:hypothetical protein